MHLVTDPVVEVPAPMRRGPLVLLVGVMVGTVATAIGFLAFNNYATGDDDGYFLIILRGVGSGHALFTETYSQYGPAFVGAVGGVFRLTFLELTLDNARVISALFAFTTGALLGVVAARVTRSAALGLVSFAAAAMAAPLESNIHPSFLIEFLVAALLCVGATKPAGRRLGLVAGAVVGTLLLAKINVGALVGAAVFAALIGGRRLLHVPLRLGLLLSAPAGVLILALHSDRSVTLIATFAVSALAVGVHMRRDVVGDSTALRLCLIATLVVAVGWSGYALVGGTSLGDLGRGVLLEPLGLASAYASDFRPTVTRLPIAVVCLMIAWVMANDRFRLTRSPALSGTLRIFGGAVLLVCMILLRLPDLEARARIDALALGTGLVWLPLLPRGDLDAFQRTWRAVVSAIAALLPFQAYPAAGYGAQRLVGATLFGLVAVLAIDDGLIALRNGQVKVLGFAPSRLRQIVLVSATLAMFIGTIAWVVHARHDYESGAAIDLPGARRIRTNPELATDLRHVSAALEGCPAFYTLPGLNSFYAFTQQEPPTWRNGTVWENLFAASEQERVVADLSTHRELCVVRNRRLEQVWRDHGKARPGPLRAFLTNSAFERRRFGDYEVYRILPGGR